MVTQLLHGYRWEHEQRNCAPVYTESVYKIEYEWRIHPLTLSGDFCLDISLKLLAVMAGDRRYEEILQSDNKKEVGCMCDVAERLERKGIEKGLVEGRAEGQNLLVAVVNRLRNGETAEQIIASGVDAQTVALAQSIK